jgi:polar amino acid transport system substrate-binding protein
MKPKATLFFVTVFLFFHFVSQSSALDKKIVFFTDEHKEGGYLIAITKAALKSVGYTTEVEFMPWKRALEMVMNGQNEALLAAYYTEERAVKMAYTESIGQTEIVFFKKKERDIQYSKLEDMKPYRIGIIRGASISNEFDSAAYLHKEEVRSPDLNIRKLLAGRVDLIVEQKAVILNFLRNQFPEHMNSVVPLELPLKVSQYYNAFSRDYPNYEKRVKDFNTGLKKIQSDRTYQKIIERHNHP